jgi:uncharacterized RDD family membrane protein YckC
MPMDPSIAPLRTYLLQSGPPWLRWGARMVDMWLLVLLLGALPINVDSFVSFDVTALQRMLPGFLLILIEALLLSRVAATPGKWLFGITVVQKNGGRLAVSESFRRSFSVYFLGLGAGVLTPIAAWSLWRIASKGETAWDHSVGTVVIWRRSRVRVCLGLLVLIALFYYKVHDLPLGFGPVGPRSST